MAVKTIETKAVISASDRTGSTFAGIMSKMRAMQMQSNSVSKSLARTTQVAARAQATRASGIMTGGRALVGAVAAYGVGGQIKQSVRDWADLEAAVTRLGNTGEVTDEKIKQAINEFRKLGPTMGVSAKEVASAAEIYVAAGIDFDKAIEATPAALKAAKASGADLNDIASSGVAAMNNLGIKAGGLDRAFDIMAKGGKLGSFELKNMARELPAVASRAKALGLVGEEGLTKIVAMLETTRKTASTGEEAANNLLNFFDKIVSQDTTKHFKKMGINLEKELKAGAAKGKDYIQTTLELVEKVAGTDPFKIAQLFPDRQAREGIMALIKFKDEYRSTVQELKNNSIGTNTRDFNRQMQTADEQINRLSASWNLLRGKLGEKVGVPALLPVVDELNRLFDIIDMRFSDPKGWEEHTKKTDAVWQGIKNNSSLGRPGMRGSNQDPNAPAVVQARRARETRDYEDNLQTDIERTQKKIDEMSAKPVNPFLGKRNEQGKIDTLVAGRDRLQQQLDAMRANREAIARLVLESMRGAQELSRISGLGINQVPQPGAPQPVLGRGAFPMSVGRPTGWGTKGRSPWSRVSQIVSNGVFPDQPTLSGPGGGNQLVSLDPNSRAEVIVKIKVDASEQLLKAFTAAQSVTSNGNIKAILDSAPGGVGSTGVGGGNR